MKLFEFEWMSRILCSLFFGFLIGYERHTQSKSAGIRTHAIVAMSACLLMIISSEAFPNAAKNDPARIAASVVSGISFLGAGVIFTHNGSIHGLTTAAGIWTVSAIGMAFGAGMYLLGMFCGIVMYAIEAFFPKKLSYTTPYTSMKISLLMDENGTSKQINDFLLKSGLNHSENQIFACKEGYRFETTIRTNKDISPRDLIDTLKKEPDIIDVEIL